MKLSPKTTWIGLIVGLLSLSVASNLFVLFVHAGSPGEVLEEDWETRANNWNETQAQRILNRKLGWKLEAHDWRVEDGRTVFSLRLSDAQGDPLTANSASWFGFARPRPGERFRGEAEVTEQGLRIQWPQREDAAIELSVDLTAQDQRFTRTWILYPSY